MPFGICFVFVVVYYFHKSKANPSSENKFLLEKSAFSPAERAKMANKENKQTGVMLVSVSKDQGKEKSSALSDLQTVADKLQELDIELLDNDYDPFNPIVKTLSTGKPVVNPSSGKILDFGNLNSLLTLELPKMSARRLDAALDLHKHSKQSINPVIQALEALPKPKQEASLDLLLNCLNKDFLGNDKLGLPILRCFFLQLVSAPYNGTPQAKNNIWKLDYVPILQGVQGCGKSRFWELIVEALGLPKFFYKTIMALPDDNEKDLKIALTKCLIAEVGEIEFCNTKKAAGQIKQKLDITEEHIRAAFGRNAVRCILRHVTVGTTNHEKPLVDETGSRRFLPLQVKKLKDGTPFSDYLAQKEGQDLLKAILYRAHQTLLEYAETNGWYNIKSLWQLKQKDAKEIEDRAQGMTACLWLDELRQAHTNQMGNTENIRSAVGPFKLSEYSTATQIATDILFAHSQGKCTWLDGKQAKFSGKAILPALIQLANEGRLEMKTYNEGKVKKFKVTDHIPAEKEDKNG